ncbi:hypothetical protein P691DRAFT_786289 [Macrolepiota fuliginosa MF-IS2]|uniref:Uncharacterized protein n=1 Tax=Macrolepiota fuliginosa MF-IS2 TaxID=1400762 RepID=A0A9P5X4L6_9AGAR|nr:hypothetical protein P691DRAFT_786289 [Macrolepiota fuliginosa MF-IS2]
MAPTYPSTIPSLHEKHPDLPPVMKDVDLHQSIQRGEDLNADNLKQASAASYPLKGFHALGLDPEIVSDAVVESAELRVTAIRNVHAAMEYTPADIAQQLQAITDSITTIRNEAMALRNEVRADIAAIRQELAVGRARTANTLRRVHNHVIEIDVFRPLEKTVPGYGFELARNISRDLDLVTRQSLEQYVTDTQNNPAPQIGTTPPDFDGNTHTLKHIDILWLVSFYNEDFGIGPDDRRLNERQRAVRNFLASF